MNKISRYINPENVLSVLVFSVFLPFYITLLASIFAVVYILRKPDIRTELLRYKGSYFLLIFFVYGVIVALVNTNFIGAACSVGFLIIMIISLFVRLTATKQSFETALNVSVISGGLLAVVTIIEWLIKAPGFEGIYRCQAYCFNPNYLATLLATVIIICAYKVMTKQGRRALYYTVAVLCFIGVYFSGSLFALVEIFIGVAMIFFLTREQQLLGIFLLIASTAIIVIYCMPELLPRLSETSVTTGNRVKIWAVTIAEIKKNFVFGGGFLNYYNIYNNYPGSYPTTHAHNILLDGLLNFGIVGIILIAVYFVFLLKRVNECRTSQEKSKISVLVMAITVAMAVHSMIDLTFLWIQTGLFVSVIFGAVGVEERILNIKIGE